MKNRECEFVIVGTGAGGSTLARGLALKGCDVLIVERGRYEKEVGTLKDYLRIYDVSRSNFAHRHSLEGIMLFRAFLAGGTTVVSCGNGLRSLEKELVDLGIRLDQEFSEAENEIQILPIPDHLLSETARKAMWAAETVGVRMKPMPKFIRTGQCSNCGKCIAGCSHRAKWTARDYVDQALKYGANILYETTAQRVILENGKAKGIIVSTSEGEMKVYAKAVILAAGGFATPTILQRSGIREAGSGLFVDLFVNTYGVSSNGLNQINEPTMSLYSDNLHKDEGFILSPFVNPWQIGRLAELGPAGLRLPAGRLIGMMTKIADESSGRVLEDGRISKSVTDKDRKTLNRGCEISKEILVKMGADEASILFSKPQGAHPGGTSAIGTIVDYQLQTKEIDNLFVCDGSVLPKAPGLPPILTIVALAKRLAGILN